MKTLSIIFLSTLLGIMMQIPTEYDYEAAWKIVRELESKGFRKDLGIKLDEILSQAKKDHKSGQAFAAFEYKMSHIVVNQDSIWLAIEEQMSAQPDPSYRALLLAKKANVLSARNRNRQTDIAEESADKLPSEMSPNTKRELATKFYLEAVKEESLKRIPVSDLRNAVTELIQEHSFIESLNAHDLVIKAFLDFLSQDQGLEDLSAAKYSLRDYMADRSQFIQTVFPSDGSNLDAIADLFKKLLTEKRNNELAVFYMDKLRMDFYQDKFHSKESKALRDDFFQKASNHSNQDISLLAHFELINDRLNPDSSYTAIIEEIDALKKSHAGSKFISKLDELRKNLTAVQTTVSSSKTFATNEAVTFDLQLRNVASVKYGIYELSTEDVLQFAKRSGDLEQLTQEWLNSKKAVRESNINFSGKIYKAIKHELKVPKMEKGAYFIHFLAKGIDGDSQEQQLIIQISDLTAVAVDDQQQNNLFILDRISGKPVQGAKAEYFVKGRSYRSLDGNVPALKLSDKEGKIVGDGRGYFGVIVSIKKDTFISIQDGVQIFDRTVNQDGRQKQAIIYTDRSIYRPGQTVYYKIVLSEYAYNQFGQQTSRKIISGEQIRVGFRDANYEEISNVNAGKTNSYGSVSGQFTIPKNRMNGFYLIETAFGNQNIKVEEYKRPSFDLESKEMVKGKSRQDISKMVVLAQGLAGNPITSAKVSYTVTRSVVTPRCYWFMPYSDDSEIISSGVGTTDEKGLFQLEVQDTSKLIPEPINKTLVYRVDIRVTDQSGETRDYSNSFTFSNQEYFLTIVARAQIDKSDKDPILIQAFDHNMDSVNIKTLVSVYEEKTPSEWMNLNEGRDVFDQETDMSSLRLIRTFELESWNKFQLTEKPGRYYIQIQTLDKKAKIGHWVSLTDFKKKKFPESDMFFAQISAEKAEPGQRIDLNIGANKKTYVRLILKRGNTELKNQILEVKGNKSWTYHVDEEDRGGLAIFLYAVKSNRAHSLSYNIEVPWSNKELDVKIETLRNLILPGSREEITIGVYHKNQLVKGELLASLYDGSLDLLNPHQWNHQFYYNNYSYVNWRNLDSGLQKNGGIYVARAYFSYPAIPSLFNSLMYEDRMYKRSMSSAPMAESVMEDQAGMLAENASSPPPPAPPPPGESTPEIRENLNELVFFKPDLKPGDDGKFHISYTMNDALTRWHLMLLAHDEQFRFGFSDATITTQKPLMIKSNKPRIIRTGDILEITANVSNLGKEDINKAVYKIDLIDALTGLPVNWVSKTTGEIALKMGETRGVSWKIEVPEKTQTGVLQFTMSVSANGNSDAERDLIPIVSNKILVTESYAFGIRAGEFYNKDLKLSDKPEKIVLEYTADPIWTAFAALPSITEQAYPSAYSLIERIYGLELGRYIMQNSPDFRQNLTAFLASKQTYQSKLQENEELKNLILQATPFVSAAKSEVKNFEGLSRFLEANQIKAEIEGDLAELKKYQKSDGGFGWSEGSQSDEYTTAKVLLYLTRLNDFGINTSSYGLPNKQMAEYLLKALDRYYLKLKERNQLDKYTAGREVQTIWLIVQNMEASQYAGSEAYKFFLDKNMENWNKVSADLRPILGQLALVLGKQKVADNIFKYYEQNKIENKEFGLYWESRSLNAFYAMPIQLHAAVMDFYRKMGASERQLDEMKIYLIKNKQVNGWPGNSQTSDAVYALLMKGKTKESSMSRTLPIVQVNQNAVDLNFDGVKGQAYIKKDITASFSGNRTNLFEIKNTSDHINYGGLYVQYYEAADKVKSSTDNPLKLRKELYVERIGKNGKELQLIDAGTKLKPGDVVVSRLIIETDRDMDYITLTDTRPAGMEPIKEQGGFGFWFYPDYSSDITDYQVIYFFYSLPKGKKILENRMIAVHGGNFSGGLSSLQSQYSPEFAAHTEGVRISISR